MGLHSRWSGLPKHTSSLKDCASGHHGGPGPLASRDRGVTLGKSQEQDLLGGLLRRMAMCVHLCVHMHTRVCVHVCTHVYICMCMCTQAHICACVFLCADMYRCVDVCTHMHVCIMCTLYAYAHICIHVCTNVHVYAHICMCVYMHVHAHMHMCMCVTVYAHMHTCRYTCAHVSMCMHVYMYMCICIYIWMWLMPWHTVVAQLMKIPSCNTALLFHLCSSEQPKIRTYRAFLKLPPTTPHSHLRLFQPHWFNTTTVTSNRKFPFEITYSTF